jgi:hypothetical protein
LRRRVLAVTAMLSWVVAIALTAGTVLAGSGSPAAPSDPRPIPALTDAERADAAQLASDELGRLIGTDRFSVREVGVWHTHGKRKLGAVVVISAHAPGPFRAAWPMIDYDRSETSQQGYADDVAQFTASHVKEFLVLVDLRRGRVVQVDPSGPDVEVTNAAGDLRRRSTPLGD